MDFIGAPEVSDEVGLEELDERVEVVLVDGFEGAVGLGVVGAGEVVVGGAPGLGEGGPGDGGGGGARGGGDGAVG